MDWLAIILIGAFIGWIASLFMKTNIQQGAIANILVGIFGSLLGKWIFADVLGIGGAAVAGSFSIMGVVWGVVGAIILIIVLQLFGVFIRKD